MSQKRKKRKPEEYYALFEQGLDYKEVAERLKVDPSGANRRQKKYNIMQQAELIRKEAMADASIVSSQIGKITVDEEMVEKALYMYEYKRMKMISKLRNKLSKALDSENLEAAYTISTIIQKMGEPMTSISNFRGFKP